MAEVKLSQESYDELLKDIKALRLQADTYFEQWQEAKRKAEAFDEIDNLIYEVFEMMNCFKYSFINENKELILDRESNIFFSLKDCANKLDLVVKFIRWVSGYCIENISSKRTQVFTSRFRTLYW